MQPISTTADRCISMKFSKLKVEMHHMQSRPKDCKLMSACMAAAEESHQKQKHVILERCP